MKKMSGFTFVHNAIEGGYPIVEAIQAVRPVVDEIVAVDMQSTDGTRDLLERLGVRVLDSDWTPGSGESLVRAHALHTECIGDVIVHFEADEVYSNPLLWEIYRKVREGQDDLQLYRIQVEQNFQRGRWYPHIVHRVFPKGTTTKVEHTTDRAGPWGNDQIALLGPEYGLLWDCSSTHRDNWIARCKQQAELWGGEPKYRITPQHFLEPQGLTEAEAREYVKLPHWTWRTSPFDLPGGLKALVGKVKYEP